MEKHIKKEVSRRASQLIIDASYATLGRLASFAAKQALTGKRVVIVNSCRAIVLGSKSDILNRYNRKKRIGKGSLKGPYFPRSPGDIIKRTIRGMLPYKSSRGRNAFKLIKCYASVPSTYLDSKKIVSKRQKPARYLTLGEIS